MIAQCGRSGPTPSQRFGRWTVPRIKEENGCTPHLGQLMNRSEACFSILYSRGINLSGRIMRVPASQSNPWEYRTTATFIFLEAWLSMKETIIKKSMIAPVISPKLRAHFTKISVELMVWIPDFGFEFFELGQDKLSGVVQDFLLLGRCAGDVVGS